MGLPARQRRVLDRIESTLRGSDPRLSALYALFARLTRDEEMPRIEQLRHSAVLLLGRLRFRLASVLFRMFGRLIPRQRAVLLFPLALALAITSIVFAAQSGSGSGCAPGTTLPTGGKFVRPAKVCKPPQLSGYYIGR
jgi:hypothetical protein